MLRMELDSSSSEGFISNNEDSNIHVSKTVKYRYHSTLCGSHQFLPSAVLCILVWNCSMTFLHAVSICNASLQEISSGVIFCCKTLAF